MAEKRRLHLTFDGVHLNNRGADLWATVILRALTAAESREGRPPSEPGQADLQARDEFGAQRGARAVDGQAVRSPLRAPGTNLLPLVRNLDLGCTQRGLLPVCYSPGREARAQDSHRAFQDGRGREAAGDGPSLTTFGHCQASTSPLRVSRSPILTILARERLALISSTERTAGLSVLV